MRSRSNRRIRSIMNGRRSRKKSSGRISRISYRSMISNRISNISRTEHPSPSKSASRSDNISLSPILDLLTW